MGLAVTNLLGSPLPHGETRTLGPTSEQGERVRPDNIHKTLSAEQAHGMQSIRRIAFHREYQALGDWGINEGQGSQGGLRGGGGCPPGLTEGSGSWRMQRGHGKWNLHCLAPGSSRALEAFRGHSKSGVNPV